MAAPKKNETLSKALSKRPTLGPREWDFRWVKDDDEALAVYRYELIREILRESKYALKSEKKHQRFLKCIKDEGWDDPVHFSPIYDLTKDDQIGYDLQYFSKISKGQKLTDGLPPDSYSVKSIIRKYLRNKKPQPSVLIRRQQPGIIDSYEADHGPFTVMELVFLNYEYPTKKEVKLIINKWIEKFKQFPENESGRPVNPLIKLAAYRFAQRVSLSMNRQHAFTKELNLESKFKRSTCGNSLYKKYLKQPAVSQSSWSDDINSFRKILINKTRLIASYYGII
jgi:hypothetical protein